MAWEYEGLFDAIPEAEDNLLAEYWRSEETDIRVGSMGYRTCTIKAGTRLEAEIYPIFGRRKEKEAKKAKRNETPDSMKKINMRNAKRWLILLMEENFKYFKDDLFTLTYAVEPEDEKRLEMDMRNFMLRVKRFRKKHGLPEMRYVWSYGHDACHRMHIHGAMTGGIDRDDLIKLWGKGIVNSSPMQNYGNGAEGAANYLYEQNEMAKKRGERINFHMWRGSKNLDRPKEHKSDSKISNRKVKQIAKSFGAMAKEILEKIYPGYILEKPVVPQFSDLIDGVYIRCIMRKDEGPNEKRAKDQKRPAHYS